MSEKKRGLAEFLGLSGVDPVTGEALPLSPLDGAAMGLQKLGERGSAALRPLGAKLDARLGTTARQRPPREPDPLMPQETTPPANLGLLETLGHAVPHIATAVAGMKMPMDGPTGPGVAAFPTPKQSFARMQEEAVFRDAMEAKGARSIEPPARLATHASERVPAVRAMSDELTAIPEAARRSAPINEPLRERYHDAIAADMDRIAGAERANAASRHALPVRWNPDEMPSPDGPGAPDFYGVQALATQAVKDNWKRVSLSTPNPRAKIPGAQSELERYLADIYGPRAK